MKQKYFFILLFLFLQHFASAQCNYNNQNETHCPTGYTLSSPNSSSKEMVQLGTDFLRAGLLKCSSTNTIRVVEFVLTNSCGVSEREIIREYACGTDFCMDEVKLFPHSSDTAWLVFYGQQYRVFKISKQLDIIPVLTEWTPVGGIVNIKEFPSHNVGVLYNNGNFNSLYKLYNTTGGIQYTASPLALNGFWISNFYSDKLLGHSLDSPNKFLELKLNSQGEIVSDTFLMSSPKLLQAFRYSFSEPNQMGQKHLMMLDKNSVSVYPVLGWSIGPLLTKQETYIEKNIVSFEEFITLESEDVFLKATPESYVWSSTGALITCIPSTASYIKPGGTSYMKIEYTNQSIHLSNQDFPIPENLVLHIYGTKIGSGPGFSGWPNLERNVGFTCYSQTAGPITFSGLPDTIKAIPYSGWVAVNFSNNQPWDVQWIFSKDPRYPIVSGTLRDINILQQDTNGTNDSFRVCAVAYFQGSTPLKSCKVSKIAKVKQPTTAIVKQDAEYASLLSIYPNPSTALFNVSANPKLYGSKWDLYSSTGVLVQTGIVQTNTALDLGLASAGVYYLKVDGFTYRLVKL